MDGLACGLDAILVGVEELLTVVFMLWHDPKQRWRAVYDYGVEHVRRARNMVSRHLTMPHRFVLATDNPGLAIDMRKVPLPADLLACGHRWSKLVLFSDQAVDLFGERILYFDLDMVVVDSLDLLVSDDDFRIVKQTLRTPGMHYNSSIMLLTAGTRNQVWKQFDPRKAEAVCRESGYQASDQFWIAKVLGANEATWSREQGVYQFRDIMDPAQPLPDDARIVIFPGPHDPSVLRTSYPWIERLWN